MCTHQKLPRISSSGLSNKDPSSSFQLHLIRGPLDVSHLRFCVTVEVEHHLVIPHSDGEPSPGVHHGWHEEPGCLVRLIRVRLRVVQDDVLVAALHF